MKNAPILYKLDTGDLANAATRAGWTADPEFGWKRPVKKHDKAEVYFFSGPNKNHGFVCPEDSHVYVRFANLALAYDDAGGVRRKSAA